jgi:anti-sigma-K factor RskA
VTSRATMACATVDELAPAYGVGAVDPEEEREVSLHLATCAEPHVEARELIGAASLLPAALEPAAPSAALRERLMATIERTPQEHRAPVAPRAYVAAPEPRRPWWSFGPLPAAVTAVALAAAIGLGAWGASANAELAEREELLRAVASADVAYRVSGEAGDGWVLQTGDQAMFMADDLATLPADRHYALWLIHEDGTTVRTGAVTDTEGVSVASLEDVLSGAATFAVTVEEHVADTPSGEPVLTAQLGA